MLGIYICALEISKGNKMRGLPAELVAALWQDPPPLAGTLGSCPPFPLELTIFQVPFEASSSLLHDRHSTPLVIIAEGALVFTFPFFFHQGCQCCQG